MDDDLITQVARIFAREFALEFGKLSRDCNVTPPAPPPETSRRREVSEYINARELSERLDIPVTSIWHLTRNGMIPHLKAGTRYRYDYEAVIEALENPRL